MNNPDSPSVSVAERENLASAAYEFLLTRKTTGTWLHVGNGNTGLARSARAAAERSGIKLTVTTPFDAPAFAEQRPHIFLEADCLSAGDFVRLIDDFCATNSCGTICGNGFLESEPHRRVLLDRFPDRLTVIGSSIWWVVTEPPAKPPDTRGAVCVPCFRDTWRIEENLAWRTELVSGLDVHIFDDNFEPAESDRLQAIARNCGWRYHASNLGEHPDYTGARNEFSAYNRFIWESLTGLADGYDFVIKMDTDACIVEETWWHEIAARLTGQDALLGTFDFRPIREVEQFWDLAGRHGHMLTRHDYPMHIQGGIYAISQGAMRLLKAMGFMAGEHRGFTEDGYMSYSAQCLGIELLPATTFGSWSYSKQLPLQVLTHLKALHPLMRREWSAVALEEGTDAG